jgi:hypothetical protein
MASHWQNSATIADDDWRSVTMANVLYPTRGADPTYRNQDGVIEYAREQGATLFFLYVSDVRFLDHFASPVPVDLVRAEIDEMGEFMLAMAQERAERKGVQAQTLVRSGEFLDVLSDVVRDLAVEVVILGRPARETAITTPEYIGNLARTLEADLEVEVLVVDDGEIVDPFAPDAMPD